MGGRELEVIGRTRRGIRHTHRHGMRFESGPERMVVPRRISKVLPAVGLPGTARQNPFERMLGIERHSGAEGELRWHDAIEDHATGLLGVTPQVVLSNPSPVGHPI